MDKLLDKYIQDWKLESCEKLVSTFTSEVYCANSKYGKVLLKILSDVGVKDELPGTFFLENCSGIGAANIYQYDDRALLIEFLPGENLYQFSRIRFEQRASEIFCEIIKKIHNIKNIQNRRRLILYTDLFMIFDRVAMPQELDSIVDKARELAKRLVATQTQEVLLHGDLHHENVMSRSSGEFVCFDPKGLIGDPAYELGTTLKNPWGYPEVSQNINLFKDRAKYFSRELNLPYERIVGFTYVHLALSIAWAIEDNDKYDHQQKLIQKVDQIIN